MQKFVLKYEDGRYVQRDHSSGPMSTGGYPMRVVDLDRATFFPTAEKAIQYAEVMRWDGMEPRVYPVDYVVGEPIDYVEVWVGCNHRCKATKSSTASEAKHFLDCPVWTKSLENMKRLV